LLPNITELTPMKLVPLMITVVPAGPIGGVKFVIVGIETIVKFVALVAVAHQVS